MRQDPRNIDESIVKEALERKLKGVAPQHDLWPAVQEEAQRQGSTSSMRWPVFAFGSAAVGLLLVMLLLTQPWNGNVSSPGQALLSTNPTPTATPTPSLPLLPGQPTRSSGDGNVPTGASIPGEGYGFSSGGSATVNDAPYDLTFFKNYGVNPFIDTEDDHLSTFAMDVDTASYVVARRFVQDGHLPDPDSVRVEEFINYFRQDYEPPIDGAFAIHIEGSPSPFGGDKYKLMRIGLQGQYISDEERLDASLVFVIDVSGSMQREERLGLVKEALRLLVEELRPTDEVGIVVYGSQGQVLLEPVSGGEKETILEAIDSLEASGSTYAEEGLKLGYEMAARMQRPGRITRLVLCSDGVANVGDTGSDLILEQVRGYVNEGITLSTIGFGMGNYNDVLMEQLANDGNGNYAYVDTLSQSRRVFVENLTGMLQVIAKDAKVQVDFNPDVVSRYRLLGYENRRVDDEDFRDDSVDAGEVGAGHSVTALYEVKLHDDAEGTVATVYIRYEDPDTGEVSETNRTFDSSEFSPEFEETSPRFQLNAAVAEYAEILRGSYWAQGSRLEDVLTLAQRVGALLPDDTDVTEFVQLVTRAVYISPTPTPPPQTTQARVSFATPDSQGPAVVARVGTQVDVYVRVFSTGIMRGDLYVEILREWSSSPDSIYKKCDSRPATASPAGQEVFACSFDAVEGTDGSFRGYTAQVFWNGGALPLDAENSVTTVRLATVWYPWFGFDMETGECVGGIGSSHWNTDIGTGSRVGITDEPEWGFYCSDDSTVIGEQLDAMQRANIDTLLVSWWGWGYEDVEGTITSPEGMGIHRAVGELFEQLRARGDPIKVALVVEPFMADADGLPTDQKRTLVDYVLQTYYEPYSDLILTWEGKPLLVSALPLDLAQTGNERVTFRMWGTSNDPAWKDYQPFGWNGYPDPQTLHEQTSDDGVVFVFPRFDEYWAWSMGWRPGWAPEGWEPRRVDPFLMEGVYAQEWQTLLESRESLNMIVVYSWNEHGDHSAVEPTIDGNETAAGWRLVDATAQYFESYVRGEPVDLPEMTPP